MLTYPHIDPVALQIGPIRIYWYGIMYLVGFAAAFWSCYYRRLKQPKPWTKDEILDLLFYAALGVVFGGTWGYLFFYEPSLALDDPWKLLKFWERGRSFHGGLLGVLLAMLLFCRLHHRHFGEVSDFVAPAVPIGLAAGRLGNFINGELWGRVTDVPWGMVFPDAGYLPRHPSQLYEFALEGVALFIILQWYASKSRPRGAVSGMFLLYYGLFRCIVEFFREPDQGLLVFGWFTKGQMLSIPMMLVGLAILFYTKHNRELRRS